MKSFSLLLLIALAILLIDAGRDILRRDYHYFATIMYRCVR